MKFLNGNCGISDIDSGDKKQPTWNTSDKALLRYNFLQKNTPD